MVPVCEILRHPWPSQNNTILFKTKNMKKKSQGESTRVVRTGHREKKSRQKKLPPEKKIGVVGWTGTPGGVWVGVWFGSQLYYPFGKGPGQHIIRCLQNKKCENERTLF